MKYLLSIIVFSTLLVGCDKFIAEDLTGKTPVVILPSDNDTSQTSLVHFKWNELLGAEKYHLMVVSPSFSAISSYDLDTFVTGTDFYYSLDSNEYEMKFTANNAGYISDTVGPIKFWVGVQSSSSAGAVTLTSPSDNIYLNSTSLNNEFGWNSLANVSSYEFSLRSGSNFSTATILETQNNISTLTYTSSITLTEAEYFWGVKAYFSTGTSTSFSTGHFYIDDTSPNIATLSLPADFTIVSPGAIDFLWNNGTDPGTIQSPVVSFIEIASDIAFTTIFDSITTSLSTETFTLSIGTYYWRVTNNDSAGNSAASSSVYKVTAL